MLVNNLNEIKEQLSVVREKHKDFLNSCKTLDELSLNQDTDLKFAVRKLLMSAISDIEQLIIDTDSQIEFAEIRNKAG